MAKSVLDVSKEHSVSIFRGLEFREEFYGGTGKRNMQL
jgi:hypothetical protein